MIIVHYNPKIDKNINNLLEYLHVPLIIGI